MYLSGEGGSVLAWSVSDVDPSVLKGLNVKCLCMKDLVGVDLELAVGDEEEEALLASKLLLEEETRAAVLAELEANIKSTDTHQLMTSA